MQPSARQGRPPGRQLPRDAARARDASQRAAVARETAFGSGPLLDPPPEANLNRLIILVRILWPGPSKGMRPEPLQFERNRAGRSSSKTGLASYK
jgi:hypothetical protein